MDWAGEQYEVDFFEKMLVGGGSFWEGLHAEIKVGLGNAVFEVILKKCEDEIDADGL